MQENQFVSADAVPLLVGEMEQSSLFQLSKSYGIPLDHLLVAANRMTGDRPLPALFPGPVAVHVDGVRLFTPTELGGRVGLSAKKFNLLLVDHGLQEKRNGQWCATEAGQIYGVMLQVHKKQRAGTDVLQLKWKETVLRHIGVAG